MIESKTVSGAKVTNLKYVPFNSAGDKVTYPVKGTIWRKKNSRTVPEYCIWSIQGKRDVVWNRWEKDELVIPPELQKQFLPEETE